MYTVTDKCNAHDIFTIEKECFPDDFWSFELIEKDLSQYIVDLLNK